MMAVRAVPYGRHGPSQPRPLPLPFYHIALTRFYCARLMPGVVDCHWPEPNREVGMLWFKMPEVD